MALYDLTSNGLMNFCEQAARIIYWEKEIPQEKL